MSALRFGIGRRCLWLPSPRPLLPLRAPHPGPRQEQAEEAAALEGPPDLAVEVVSPSETRPRVLEKVQWYLEAGCPLVWVIDPQRRTAAVYRPGAAVRQLGAADALDGEDVLPGFRLPLADLWCALGPSAST